MRKLEKIMFLIFVILTLLSLTYNVSYAAASTTFNVNDKELTVGDTTTITVGIVNTETWNLSVTADGGSITGTTSSTDANGSETTKDVISCNFSAAEAGIYTITLTGTVAGSDLQIQNVSNEPIIVTVKEKEETPTIPVEPETPPTNTETPDTTPNEEPTTPTQPNTPTVTEPTFRAVNETVYAIRNVNVRESYSTSSRILGSLSKDESVTRIGIGSNGWSKVTYKGATAYISANYLTTTKPEEKSNNAYLKSLTIEGQEIFPEFNKETTSYTMQITNDITELDVKAEAEDEKATVEVKGNKDLKEGENTVTVSVNAEDNTIKIYEIKVTKAEKIALGLKSLEIEGTNIASIFKPELYEYEIDVYDELDIEKLEIEAIANDETATVEVLGNENLVEGENIITIIVSSQDGKEKVTYQITANIVIEEIEPVIIEQETQGIPKIYLYIALGAVVLIALIIVIVYTIRHRNTDEYDFSDNFEGFPEELPEKKEDSILFTSNNKEETQGVDILNEKIDNNQEIDKVEDTKSKIDYFLDDSEEPKTRRRKGKHF